MAHDIQKSLTRAREGVSRYLDEARDSGRIDGQLHASAMSNTYPQLSAWLSDPYIDSISPNLKKGIIDAIDQGKWMDLVNAFRQGVRFGTGGIRGMMALDRESIIRLQNEGLDAPILKGPNTINNIVFLLTSVGVAKFGNDNNLTKIVIGYDSRVRGHDLAKIVAELFLAYDFTVYFFDAPCPYPEVTFAIPDASVQADMGILISASHNDYRYNGYKLSCGNGSQFDPEERDVMYKKYIQHAQTKDIKLRAFKDAAADRLYFLGGDAPVPGFDYAGKGANLINIHERHRNHVKSFMMTADMAELQKKAGNPLKIGYCAFHGAGNIAVPRLLRDVGYREIYEIRRNDLGTLNGLFPSFRSAAGMEQQPDPGDPRAARIAVDAFKEDHPGKFDEVDVILGTDPDADRCGVIVKVPDEQQFLYNDQNWTLLSSDDLWGILIWYRIQREIEKHGKIIDADKKFITLSHTTSDSISLFAQKHGLGVVKTWVGFAALSAATRDVWDGRLATDKKYYLDLVEGRNPAHPDLSDMLIHSCYGMGNGRSINIAAMEQSNGFTILGGPPKDKYSLGTDGHVRDKDGTFAAFLVAEVAAWAKQNNTTIFDLIDKQLYMDPAVGIFINGYEPDPMDGEYPGIEGDRLKKAILRRALGYFQLALAGDLSIGGIPVKSATIYRTGKYDAIYPPSYDFVFPDEGIRFFFDDERMNHVTVRPSGTGNSLRFHTQLRDNDGVSQANLVKKKYELKYKTDMIFKDLRDKLRAPKGKMFI